MVEKRWKAEWFKCPECSGRLVHDKAGEMECRGCGKVYTVKHNIPIFLPAFLKTEEASEKEFWENSYDACEDGSFKTLTDASYTRVLDRFSVPGGKFGLEFGCGSGAFSDYIENSSMVGLDISFSLLERSHSIIPVQGSGEALPFDNGLFDFVLCTAALHHIPSLEKAVREIGRVLSANGFLYIFEPNMNHPQRKLVSSKNSIFRKTFTTTHFSPEEILIPEERLTAMLQKNAFSIEAVTYMTPVYRRRTAAGRIQELVSGVLARGPLSRYFESYYLIKARKNDT